MQHMRKLMTSSVFTLFLSFIIVCLMDSTSAVIDQADREVSLVVTVPQDLTLTVKPGENFRTAAFDFCRRHNLDLGLVANLTRALENQYENDKILDQPLLSVNVNVSVDVNNETKISTELLQLYEGDTLFDAAYRFCRTHGLNMYTFGSQLEDILMQAVQQVTAEAEKNQQQNQNQIAGESTGQNVAVGTGDGAVNSSRFKLFGLPVTVDNETFELEFYNGDRLDDKIEQFCGEHGLNVTVVKPPLIEAVMNVTSEIQKRYPNSIFVESL